MTHLPWGTIRSLLAKEPSQKVFQEILAAVEPILSSSSYTREMLPYLSSVLQQTWPSYEVVPRKVGPVPGIVPLGNRLTLRRDMPNVSLEGQLNTIQYLYLNARLGDLKPQMIEVLSGHLPHLTCLHLSQVHVLERDWLHLEQPLKKLVLDQVSRDVISSVFSHPEIAGIQHLTLDRLRDVEDRTPFPALKSLDISCPSLSIKVLNWVGQQPSWSSGLEVLCMSSEIFQKYVVTFSCDLQDLTLVGSWSGLSANLDRALPQLKRLSLDGDNPSFFMLAPRYKDLPLLEEVEIVVRSPSMADHPRYHDWIAALQRVAPHLKKAKIRIKSPPEGQSQGQCPLEPTAII